TTGPTPGVDINSRTRASARLICRTGGNDLATLLVACGDLQSDAGLLKGFGHRFNRGRTKCCFVGQMLTNGHEYPDLEAARLYRPDASPRDRARCVGEQAFSQLPPLPFSRRAM